MTLVERRATHGRRRVTGRWQGASGRSDRSIRSSQNLPSEGVTASLAHGAINKRWSQPWLVWSTSGDFVSMLESAWEPSISHMLDSDHPIV